MFGKSGIVMYKIFHRNWLVLFGVVTGITGTFTLPAAPLCWTVSAGAGLGLLYFRQWRNLSLLGLGIAAGALAAWTSDLRTPPLLHDRAAAVTVQIADAGATGPALRTGDPLPYRVAGRIVQGAPERTVQLYFPRRTPNPGVADGELWRVSGTLYADDELPEYRMLGGDGKWRDVSSCFAQDGFRNYLAARDISGTLTVRRLEPLESPASSGWRAHWRRALLERLDRGIDDPDQRSVLEAITLGMRSQLTTAQRDKFQATGVAHLFSVSGLHVGILAALLLLTLRSAPLYWHGVCLCTLVVYVLLTGGNAPAIRAFALILGCEWLRSRLLWVRPLELLGLIGAGLLLIQPHFLVDAGFQYSFVITAFLILAAAPAREIMAAGAGSALRFGMLSGWRKRLLGWRGKLLAALFFATVASVSGMALSLFHQYYFFPGAILVNLLVLPVLTPLFALAVAKCALPALAAFWNIGLNALLGWLDGCLNYFQTFSQSNELAVPGWAGVVVFGALLSLALLGRKHVFGVAALGGVLLWTASRVWLAGAAPDAVAFVAAGGSLTHPVAAILHPAAHRMTVLNAGRDGAFALVGVARHYGISRIDRLDFGVASVDTADGLTVLERALTIEEFRLPEAPIRSASFRKILNHRAVRTGAGQEELTGSGNPAGTLRIRSAGDGGWLMEFGGRQGYVPRTAVVRIHLIEKLN